MGHAEIENRTPFAFQPLFVSDEEGRPLLVVVVKATYAIVAGTRLELAPKQAEPKVAGEYWGDPDSSSPKYEPEVSLSKPATDVVLIGHACARARDITEVLCEVRLGALHKAVRVLGDRVWLRSLGTATMTRPRPFERIPLVYEKAFGGWDRTPSDPGQHTFEPRNPVGIGFHSKQGKLVEGARLPNLEDPKQPLRGWQDTPPPAGFGFIAPSWQPRIGYAGTYDGAWQKDRMPLLPKDFDPRFFSAASPGLVAPGFLKGNEPVVIDNASPGGRLAFTLPGIPPPRCRIHRRGGVTHDVETRLDTIILNTDENLVFLLWRGRQALRVGPHEVSALEVDAVDMSARGAAA
jgi:hypothetical protein